jgi:hypothetical protein
MALLYPPRLYSPFFATVPRGRPAGAATASRPHQPAIADCRLLARSYDGTLRTRIAGLFLFLPLLAQLSFDRLVRDAGYPGSRMIPAPSALLSLLALKLLDKERRSHIDDFNFDEALGLFAGLNVLPKKSFATDYSYRTQRYHQERLLSGWVGQLAPRLFPEPEIFNLDFHAIPYRGDLAELENHYQPCRGKAGPSVLTFFAQEHKSQALCYANANLLRQEQPGEILRFVEFWHQLTGSNPHWLCFDSKLTNYSELSRVNQRGISFITIRRRGAAITRRLQALPANAWRPAWLDIPKRLHKQIRYVEESIKLDGYQGTLRQIAVAGLGRERFTLFLCNNTDITARDLVIRYARRNGIEDGLGISVNFFHLDCLASEVRLNVDIDVALTVIANGCYRWLATRLKGFDKSKPKDLFRKFVETAGRVIVKPNQLIIHFDRRSHNPILREAALDQGCPPIPWLGNRLLVFTYH